MSALITAAFALKRLFSHLHSPFFFFFFFRFQASWAHRRDRRVCCNSVKWHTRTHAHGPAPFPSLLCWAEGSGCWRVTTTLLCCTCLHFSGKLGLVFADRGCSKEEKKKKFRPRSFYFYSSHNRKSTDISEASSCDQHFYSHRCSTNDWQHFWNAQSRLYQSCRLIRRRHLIWTNYAET